MFVDASAIVAMMTEEQQARSLASKLDGATTRLTSPIAVFEATAAVARILTMPVRDAAEAVARFVALLRIEIVALTPETTPLAVAAFARYGKGQRHPAQLNMGDCFAYACARYHEQPLLYTGNDFSATDIERA